MMPTYSLINYFDVWGNAKDGWEVNNLCTEKLGSPLLMMRPIKRF